MGVRTPVEGFSGDVAGVTFVDGEAVGFADPVPSTEDQARARYASAMAYFRRHGYIIEATAPPVAAADPEEQAPQPPARNASTAIWVAYAISAGMDPDEAEATSRDDLADRYSPKGSQS